jgi:UPF0755 protein
VRFILAILLIGIVLVGGAWFEYDRFVSTPIDVGGKSEAVDIPPGTSLRRLSEELAARGIISNPYLFMALARMSGDASRIQAGEYAIASGLTPPQLLALFASGKVIQHAVTIVEGWTFRQAFAAIAADDRFVKRLEGISCDELMTRLGDPGQNPEGRFFPDTYHFTKGTSDLDILRRAHRMMETVLAEEWDKRAKGLPLRTPDEALTLASIVEKEAALASERDRIAGVFIRRLALGMKLQTDPTVIYGLRDSYDGNLTRADLAEDTPYNSYLHKGLPPSPIALAGRDAIHAALHPAEGDSLYFVARGDGSHQFSATLAEHNAAVRHYQLGAR